MTSDAGYTNNFQNALFQKEKPATMLVTGLLIISSDLRAVAT